MLKRQPTPRVDRKTCVSTYAGMRFFSPLPGQYVSKSQAVQLSAQQAPTLAQRSISVQQEAARSMPYVVDMSGDSSARTAASIKYTGVHHVALLCANLEKSLGFYEGVLGLEVNPDRPHGKLPYRGAWLWIGSEMIHLMELPNPDPLNNRPKHGGRDRHFCVGVQAIGPLVERLQAAGVEYTMSMSGRPAVFFRDPDMNCLEVVELEPAKGVY